MQDKIIEHQPQSGFELLLSNCSGL